MPDDLLQFTREVGAFLGAHAPRAAERGPICWGEGDDRVAYFGADPPEVEERKLRAARDWQRTRYGAGSAGSPGRRVRRPRSDPGP